MRATAAANEDTLATLLGGVQDNILYQFEYKGFIIRRCGSSLEFCDSYERPLGGAANAEAEIGWLMGWVENKVSLYNEANNR